MVKWDASFLKHPIIYYKLTSIYKSRKCMKLPYLDIWLTFQRSTREQCVIRRQLQKTSNKMPALEAAVLFDVAKGDLIAKAHVTSRQTSLGWLPGKARRARRASPKKQGFGIGIMRREAAKTVVMNTCEHHLNISEQAITHGCVLNFWISRGSW